MANLTNPQQWAAQERLRFIEKCAFWRGVVNRQDLMEAFGLSAAQATSDLQKFQELNSGALIYNLNKKRYEGAPSMQCKLHKPQIEEAMTLFLNSGDVPSALCRPVSSVENAANDRLAGVELLSRAANDSVHRAIFLAVLGGLRVNIEYGTMSGNKGGWRWIAPHAFGHDGYRWHVRALCEKDNVFKDFALSRIVTAEFPKEPNTSLLEDSEWQSWVTVTIGPAKGLSAEQQKSISADYLMKAGKRIFQVRKAMLNYTLTHLRIPTEHTKAPPFLELIRVEE